MFGYYEQIDRELDYDKYEYYYSVVRVHDTRIYVYGDTVTVYLLTEICNRKLVITKLFTSPKHTPNTLFQADRRSEYEGRSSDI